MGGPTCRMGVWAELLVLAVIGVTPGTAAALAEGPCEFPSDPRCENPRPGMHNLPLLLPPSGPSSLQAEQGKCEALQVATCDGALPYTSVGLPNLLGYHSQHAAGLILGRLGSAFDTQCSPDLRRLLCTILLPPCRAAPSQKLPCRSLCESVRVGCEGLMHAHGILWPPFLDCSLLPGPDKGCVGPSLPPPAEAATRNPPSAGHLTPPAP